MYFKYSYQNNINKIFCDVHLSRIYIPRFALIFEELILIVVSRVMGNVFKYNPRSEFF